MRTKDQKILIEVLTRQMDDCAKAAIKADQEQNYKIHAFQEGARMALSRAIEYVKDAQAGILKD